MKSCSQVPIRPGKGLEPVPNPRPLSILCVMATLLCPASGLNGAEWSVSQAGGADFTSVQAAIDAAAPGDVITIEDSATYIEDVIIGLFAPGQLNSKANLTLKSARGQRPTIEAKNEVDRFQSGGPDFAGLVVLSQGVTLEGLDIRNSGDASQGLLGVGVALNIHASNVTVSDCSISQENGVSGASTSMVVLISDFSRLVGAGKTIENVVLSDCVIEHGPSLGTAVFPTAEGQNPALNDTVLRVRLERCVIQNCSSAAFEADALGSVDLIEVISQHNSGDGFQLAIEQATLENCQALNNAGVGVQLEAWDVGTGAAVELKANGLTCLGNRGGGITLNEGTADIQHLVAASNLGFNFRIVPTVTIEGAGPLTATVDHATLYYVPEDAEMFPNVLVEIGNFDPALLTLRNSLVVGPVGIDNLEEALFEDELVVDFTMLWNGGAEVANQGPFTATNPVPPADPLFIDPERGDFRIQPNSPVAAADDQSGPLGGAGVAQALPDEIVITAVGTEDGKFYLEWSSFPNLVFDIVSGTGMNTDDWVVVDTVAGVEGTQRWTDDGEVNPSRFYYLVGKLPTM